MSVRTYRAYVTALRALVAEALRRPERSLDGDIAAALDGQPARELRRLVPLTVRRATGAFFTGSSLARDLLASVLETPSKGSVFCDPACGAGDLLIAAADKFPVHDDLRQTLRSWSPRLHGFDLHSEFVEAAQLRIVLAALRRGARTRGASPNELARLLSGIRVADGLKTTVPDVDVVLMNPPYGARVAPTSCDWAAGRVNDAALFTHSLISRLPAEVQVIAILPDVLRTGSRYEKWRQAIEEQMAIENIQVIGIFDEWADVDVFVLSGTTGQKNGSRLRPTSWWSPHPSELCVGDLFSIHVGAVVPHRDAQLGPWRKYLHARMISNVSAFDTRDAPSRRFERRTFKPPFVAIRRTSRPDDRRRAIGTIITGDAEVAVENHLIVAIPRTGSIEDCEALVASLTERSTTEWLNRRIRCRHLTVRAVTDIPWVGAE